jgi:hypothetical protein
MDQQSRRLLFGTERISYYIDGSIRISFNSLPLFVLAAVTLVIVGFGEYLIRRGPVGPQPAAFGHLQTLADLVDDGGTGLTGRIFWGQKEE